MSGLRKKLAVLVSGRGSNMEAILKASLAEDYPAEIGVVISDNPDAAGLVTANAAGIPALAFARNTYGSKAEHEAAIRDCIEVHAADIVCLAGYMRLLSAGFVTHFDGRLVNIHPSLLPRFKGLDTHARALQAGETEHGCTVHYVNAEMDGGEIISQAQVPVQPGDTPDTLAARVLAEEHRLYPAVIAQLCTVDT